MKFFSVKGDWSALDKSVIEAMTCLQCYLTEFDKVHKRCLKKIVQGRKPPPEVLACHLFSQLASESDIYVDENDYYGNGCPWCSERPSNVRKENTSFGHPQYWHGRGDIVIVHRGDRSTNVVTIANEPDETERYIDCESDELEKYTREADGHVDNYIAFSSSSTLRNQVLSQTITNGFLACKENKSLEDNFIPCFLVSYGCMCINLYNPKSDVLLTQGDYLPIISEEGQLNEEMVFQVWLVLNLNLFKQNIPKAVQNKEFQSCGFLDSLSKELQNIYKHHLSTVLEWQTGPPDYPTKLAVNSARSLEQLISKIKQETGD